MGKIIDNTNVLNPLMNIRENLSKNMDKDNYYLKMLQDKVNREWRYRYNIVDIEKEKDIGGENYTPIEVAIQTVYDTNQKTVMSDDWRNIVFKDIKQTVEIGERYKFSYLFGKETEELNKSIWITVNNNATSPTGSATIRRCNTFINMIYNDGCHFEPCIVEDDFNYVNLYYNKAITVPSAEIYLIMQYNKYSKKIKINDRFLLGETDEDDIENNIVFKVKAVRKFSNKNTFLTDTVPLTYVALDRDSISAEDDLYNRLMAHATIVKDKNMVKLCTYDSISNTIYVLGDRNNKTLVSLNKNLSNVINDKKDIYELKIIANGDEDIETPLLVNNSRIYSLYLYKNNQLVSSKFEVNTDLLGTTKDDNYYVFENLDTNKFKILNKRMYVKDKLKITCKALSDDGQLILSHEFYVKLGGITG